MHITQTAAPSFLPVTLAEAKLQLRVDDTDEDSLITGVLIPAAVHACEQIIGRSIMSQAWKLTLDDFEDEIRLPWPEILSVTGVQYRDVNGVTQTLDTSVYELSGDRLRLKLNQQWPQTTGDVVIDYTAGYASGTEAAQQAAVPGNVKTWILLTAGTMYANRESVLAGVSSSELAGGFTDRLLDRERVY